MRLLNRTAKRNILFTVESNAATTASSGATTQPFGVTVCKLWGELETISARDVIAGRIISPESSHRIHTLYRSDITETMRFVYGSRSFDIIGIANPDNRNLNLVFEVREGARHGA